MITSTSNCYYYSRNLIKLQILITTYMTHHSQQVQRSLHPGLETGTVGETGTWEHPTELKHPKVTGKAGIWNSASEDSIDRMYADTGDSAWTLGKGGRGDGGAAATFPVWGGGRWLTTCGSGGGRKRWRRELVTGWGLGLWPGEPVSFWTMSLKSFLLMLYTCGWDSGRACLLKVWLLLGLEMLCESLLSCLR